MKQKKLPAIAGIFIIFLVAVGLILFGSFDVKRIYDLKKNGIKTEAVVIDISSRLSSGKSKTRIYSAKVSFLTEDGREMKVWRDHNGFLTKSDINKVTVIYYDPDNPDKIIWQSERPASGVFIAGVIFLACGFLIFWQTQKKARLLSKGRRIMAEIYDINKKTFTTKSREFNHYTIYAAYTENGEKYTFKSIVTEFDPSPFLNSMVLVYVDPGNYRNYYVDTESLVNK